MGEHGEKMYHAEKTILLRITNVHQTEGAGDVDKDDIQWLFLLPVQKMLGLTEVTSMHVMLRW